MDATKWHLKVHGSNDLGEACLGRTTCCLPHCELQWNSKIPQTRNSNPQLGNTNLFHCMLQMQMFQTNMGSLNRWPLLWLLVHMCFPCLSLTTCQSNQQMPRIPQTHQNHASKRVQRLQKIRACLASKQHGETCCDTKTISYFFLSCFRDIIILEIGFQKIYWKHENIILELRVTQKSFH